MINEQTIKTLTYDTDRSRTFPNIRKIPQSGNIVQVINTINIIVSLIIETLMKSISGPSLIQFTYTIQKLTNVIITQQ